jgi:hypothetical protein
MEGHGRDLEGEPGNDEDDADDDAGRDAMRLGESLTQAVEIGRAGEAVDQRAAIEQQA